MKKKASIFSVIKHHKLSLHSWCNTSAGIVKKENKNIPKDVWDNYRKNGVSQPMIYQAPVSRPESWWNKLKLFIKKLIRYGR